MEESNLKEENTKLKSIIIAKTDTVSMVTHQVRTSLSGLKWIIKMFMNGDLGKLTPEQENLIEKAYESNERAIKNLTDLLTINRNQNVLEQKYNIEKVDLIELIETTIFDFSGEAHTKGIEVIFLKPEDAMFFLKADKEKLRVVLQNLIENAIKYSDPHGKVFITTQEQEQIIQVSIKDSGIGISKEGQAKIFEKFYRAPTARKREAIGSGIGLYTVKKIIGKMEGKIWFESTQGEGTTFYFTLPVFKEEFTTQKA